MAEKTHKEHSEHKAAQVHTEHAKSIEHKESHTAEKRYETPAGFSVRGAVLEGVVISAKAPKTITIVRYITKYVPKYERYKKIRSKVKAHLPDGMAVKEGDTVLIGETRKLSKTKNFVLLSVVKRGSA